MGPSPRFEEVAVRDTKYPHAKIFFKDLILHWLLIAVGILVIGATLSNLLLESGKIPLAYDYPVIVYLFAFIPVTMMFVIAQAFQWIRCERHKMTYLAGVSGLCALVSLGWLLTLGPAYSEAVDLSDLSAPEGFNFYPLHITLQLFGEILLGALLKIALFRMARDSRKTEPRETAASKLSRAPVNMFAIMNGPEIMEQEAISKHLNAHAAARQSCVANYLAALGAQQAAFDLEDQRADAAAMQARLALKNDQAKQPPLH